jgi:tripartite-type tricarboxylate transporter receptor subunit TctC
MQNLRKLTARLTVASLLALALIAPGNAQNAASNYPNRPVKIVIPFAPGGGTDNLMRIVAQHMRDKLGQEFILETRGGGGSAVGTIYAIGAGGDGYTLITHSSSAAINLALYGSLPYDLEKDLRPVSLLASGPVVLVTHPSTNIKSLDDLLTRAKAAPGTINFATGGNGSPPHLALELLMNVTGAKFVPVHYKGAGPATTDVLGGHVGMMFSGVSQSRELIESGKLIAIAITGDKRNAALPNVPTMAELGYPDVSNAGTYWGLLAPKGTPDEVINKLAAALPGIMKDKSLADKIEPLGFVGIGSTPQEYAAHIKGEVDRWTRVAKSGNIKPE